MSKRRHKIVVTTAICFVLFGQWWWFGREELTRLAYQECRLCGIGDDETDRLIDDVKHATLNRQELVELYLDTFDDRTRGAACMPCVHAIMDAAHVGSEDDGG